MAAVRPVNESQFPATKGASESPSATMRLYRASLLLVPRSGST